MAESAIVFGGVQHALCPMDIAPVLHLPNCVLVRQWWAGSIEHAQWRHPA